jgi:hypothetical protein
MLAIELQSNTTADTSVAELVDYYGAEDLLALNPDDEEELYQEDVPGPWQEKEPDKEEEDEEQKPKKPPKKDQQLEQWGTNPQEVKWLQIKENLRQQKQAHDDRWRTAKENPGIRDFIRPHELADQRNNWEKHYEQVRMKDDLLRRRTMALGHRCELKKPELRTIFPVVQRLIWTKWALWQIFLIALERASPTWWIYMNIARPAKTHRCVMHLLFDSTMLMASTFSLFVESPDGENIEATEVAVWTLFSNLLSTSWNVLPFMNAAIAVGCAYVLWFVVKYCFFAYKIGQDRVVLTPKGQETNMTLAHMLAESGKWLCIFGTFLFTMGTVALCALLPQPRACIVVRSYLLAIIYSHICLPIVEAIVVTVILSMARSGPVFDPLLTAYPSIMDFVSVGVEHPDFLRWRVERIVTEQEQLQLIYSAEWSKDDVEELEAVATDNSANKKPEKTALQQIQELADALNKGIATYFPAKAKKDKTKVQQSEQGEQSEQVEEPSMHVTSVITESIAPGATAVNIAATGDFMAGDQFILEDATKEARTVMVVEGLRVTVDEPFDHAHAASTPVYIVPLGGHQEAPQQATGDDGGRPSDAAPVASDDQ